MPYVKKEELRKILEAFGEVAPHEWTREQILLRIRELDEENPGASPATPKTAAKDAQQEWRVSMNRAARKKADLQRFLTDKMGLTLTYNETVVQLKTMGEEWISRMAPYNNQEKLGFGKHSDKTYHQVYLEDPQYVSWAITTAKEGQVNWRLSRFAQWAMMQKDTPPSVLRDVNKKGTSPGYAPRTPVPASPTTPASPTLSDMVMAPTPPLPGSAAASANTKRGSSSKSKMAMPYQMALLPENTPSEADSLGSFVEVGGNRAPRGPPPPKPVNSEASPATPSLSLSGPLESSVNSSLLDGSSSEEMEDDDIDEIRQLEARLQELRRKKGRSMARKTVSQ